MSGFSCPLLSNEAITGSPKQIPAERGFWILNFYYRHETQLHLGGKILDDEAECVAAKVTHVWPETLSIAVRLFDDDLRASWDRVIPLNEALFFFTQLGDPTFRAFGHAPCHSVLSIGFNDGTILVFAESEV
jgi:hypothetical protein